MADIVLNFEVRELPCPAGPRVSRRNGMVPGTRDCGYKALVASAGKAN